MSPQLEHLASDAARAREVAEEFSAIARDFGGREIWLNQAFPDLHVTVVVDEQRVERDLEMRMHFIELVSGRLDPGLGTLSIYTEDRAPSWVRHGDRLG